MNQFASSAQVLILWGHGCDEAIAAQFVTSFRQQGANVTLVGISGRRNTGAHGLTLHPAGHNSKRPAAYLHAYASSSSKLATLSRTCRQSSIVGTKSIIGFLGFCQSKRDSSLDRTDFR